MPETSGASRLNVVVTDELAVAPAIEQAAGADPTIAESDGVTPFEHAETRNYIEITNSLKASLSRRNGG